MKPTRGGPGRGQGRPPLRPGERTIPFHVRLPESLHAKLLRLGGAAWLRKRVERAHEQS